MKNPPPELILAAQMGCRKSFDTLMENIRPHLMQQLQSQFDAEPETEIEDVMQETARRVFLHLEKFRGGNFCAWIWRIAKNNYFNHLRKKEISKSELLFRLMKWQREK